jgi:DNA-binding response OmpR family regulator
MSARILIVEDEERIASLLEKGLRAEGFDTVTVDHAAEVAGELTDAELVLLDLGLPDYDGLEVLRDLRTRSNVPVIILTARDELSDRIGGLDLGADDYVTKPFVFEELLARIRARLRGATAPLLLEVGPVSLELHTREAKSVDRTETLTTREAALLEAFLRRPAEILTRDELRAAVWDDEEEAGSNVVDVYVRYLRQKLGTDIVETVRGQGYRLGAVAQVTAEAQTAT